MTNIEIEMMNGDIIKAELYPDVAPITVENFVKLINDERVDKEKRLKYHNYLTHLATVMATNGINKTTMLYGGEWWKTPADNDNVQLTAQLTGCMLMEAMCVLKKVK